MMKIQGQSSEVYKLVSMRAEKRASARDAPSKSPPADAAKAGNELMSSSMDRVELSGEFRAKQLQNALLTKIGQRVDDVLKAAGVDLRDATGLDWSAEATADRIFTYASNAYGLYADNHQEMTEREKLDGFESMIRGAVDAGAQDAMGTLKNAGFEDQTRSLAEDTMSLVHKKFDDFFSQKREELSQAEAEAAQVN